MANFGLYHPVHNPEGCKKAVDNKFWYDTATDFNSKADCFNGAKLLTNSGTIASGVSGRPDSKYADAIYADDVQDLRMSSRKLPKAEIREKYKRMAIAGEQRGFEGVPFVNVYCSGGISLSSGTIGAYPIPTSEFSGDLSWIEPARNVAQGKVLVDGVVHNVTAARFSGTSNENVFVETDSGKVVVGGEVVSVVLGDFRQTSKSAKPTWTDIIGDPARIAATFPDGVEGAWIPVIPDGTSKQFHYNRKVLDSSALDLFTADGGVSWSAGQYDGVDSTKNSTTKSATNSEVYLIHYQTQAHFTEEDDNSEVLDLGGVFASSHNKVEVGNILASSLIGKVLTEPNSTAQSYLDSVITQMSYRDDATGEIAPWGNPVHPTVALGSSNNSPAVKTLDYLSSENSVGKLMYAVKEMVWDDGADSGAEFVTLSTPSPVSAGTYYRVTTGIHAGMWLCVRTEGSFDMNSSNFTRVGDELKYRDGTTWFTAWDGNGWGDNNKFEIVDGSSAVTDDNGNDVIVATHSFKTQHFIDESDS